MDDIATLSTELERLYQRQADLRAHEVELAERGENDPASDEWKLASIAASKAEIDFCSALLRNYSTISRVLREAAEEWRPIGEEARQAGRILLGWRPFGNVREHIELGWWSARDLAWVNTYGRPFSGEPDVWMPLPPPPATETTKTEEMK